MTKQKLPQLDGIQGVKDSAIKKLLSQVKEILETREGRRGDPLEKAVTLRDLQSGDLNITVNQLTAGSSYSGGSSNDIPGGFTDLTTPPAPTGLTANGAFENIILSWSYPAYTNHAYTKIYRSGTDDFGTATLVGSTNGTVYADNVGTNASKYYWIKHVSLANVEGPINATAGTNGTTAPNVNYLRTQLANSIQETELYGALQTRINLIDAPTTGLVDVQAAHSLDIDGLNGQYSLKLDNNGHISGFGLASTAEVDENPYSDFIIQADRFSFVVPSTVWQATTSYAQYQFVRPTVSNGYVYMKQDANSELSGGSEPTWPTTPGQTVADGSVTWECKNDTALFPFIVNGGGVYMDAAYIESASITDAKISNLNADKIFAASGTIADAIIGTAHITTGMVDDLHSNNFSAGTTGWRITKAGAAEFHNVTIYDNSGNIVFQSGGRVTNRTFAQASAPTGDLLNGDLWIDTDDNNKVYVREGGAWTSRRDSTIATAQATADGKNTVFAQTTSPTANKVADLWIDTDDNNRLYRWSGSTWVDIGSIAAALTAASTAQSTADGKITAYYQASQPGSGELGDIWFDTDDKNKVYVHNGTTWASARDSDIATAIANASTAQDTADGKVEAFFAVAASPPTASGVGDIWYVTDTKEIKKWNGSTWAISFEITPTNVTTFMPSAAIGTAEIINLNVTTGKIANNAITAATSDLSSSITIGNGAAEELIDEVQVQVVVPAETTYVVLVTAFAVGDAYQSSTYSEGGYGPAATSYEPATMRLKRGTSSPATTLLKENFFGQTGVVYSTGGGGLTRDFLHQQVIELANVTGSPVTHYFELFITADGGGGVDEAWIYALVYKK